jgi:hypothetical protein
MHAVVGECHADDCRVGELSHYRDAGEETDSDAEIGEPGDLGIPAVLVLEDASDGGEEEIEELIDEGHVEGHEGRDDGHGEHLEGAHDAVEGYGGRDGKRSEAIVVMPAGKHEEFQKKIARAQARAQPSKIRSREVEWEKMERFLSGSKCRRIYLDSEMECEVGEERCDISEKNDAITERLDAQQAAIHRRRKSESRAGNTRRAQETGPAAA